MKLKRRKKFVTLKDRTPFYVLLTCLTCFGILGFLCYFQISRLLINQLKSDAMGISDIAASEISGETLLAISSEDDEEYKQVFDLLSKYKLSEQITYIYTMRFDGDDLIFVVDTDTEEPALYGDTYEFLDDMKPAFEGTTCCDNVISTDKWGRFFSAYSPVFTEDHKVAGIVGCDIDFSEIESKLVLLRRITILLATVFFSLSFFMYIHVSRHISTRDLLTEILNYDELVRIGNILNKNKKLSDYTAVIINIKDFKFLNQRIGASLGDVILREYGQYLKKIISRKEYAARTGNDNFVVLVLKENEKTFLNALRDVSVDLDNGEEPIKINVRCGIYPIPAEVSINNVLNSISVALNNARNSPSSGDFVRFEEKLADALIEEKRMLLEFWKAIAEREFFVFYQPKVDIKTHRLCGAEALVRWIRNGETIPPMKFIPALEKEGYITALDFYVFDTVCRDLKKWIESGIEPVCISSNFSKLHLKNPDFAENIFEVIEKYGINTSLVEVELTESSGYSDFEAMTAFVSKMNSANIHTSIDDFGTGYSSLSMLKDIDVNGVKIDKSFLNKTQNKDALQEKMLENVINMISDLKRTVICEGVETEQQLEFLKNAKCNIIQGYIFDKPLPHDTFELRLKNPIYK